MDVTRREFLGYTAGAIGVMGSSAALPSAPTERHVRGMTRWFVLGRWPRPKGTEYTESLQGFRRALPPERQSLACCSLIVVTSLLRLDYGLAGLLRDALQGGSTVIVETGAGFVRHLDFCRHRRDFREGLQIHLAAPVNLWASRRRAPYIEFTWPRRATVRDFTRVVPPAEHEDDVIAWAGDLAVGFRRRVGKGMLIYLGSPVGPALWAGDAEARRWLYAVALSA